MLGKCSIHSYTLTQDKKYKFLLVQTGKVETVVLFHPDHFIKEKVFYQIMTACPLHSMVWGKTGMLFLLFWYKRHSGMPGDGDTCL